eukprot:scaffold297804_cov32-Prasinocladus_malaysianus.AAC.1
MGCTGVGGPAASAAEEDNSFVAYVPLPDQKDIEKRIVDKKKADLLSKYSSAALQQTQASAKELLNKQS